MAVKFISLILAQRVTRAGWCASDSTLHSGRPWWNDHRRRRLRLSLSHGAVDGLPIIGAIGHHRGHVTRDLVEQGADQGAIADLVGGQFRGQDLVAVGINRQVKFAPSPATTLTVFLPLPLAGPLDLQPGGVDHDGNRFAARRQGRGEQQTGAPPGKRGVIRNR